MPVVGLEFVEVQAADDAAGRVGDVPLDPFLALFGKPGGAEGFEAARNVRPNIIITDMVMPIFNGLQFLKMTREPQSSVRDIPIIVLSGYLTKPATLALRELGADELLVKPVSPKALYAHIVRIVLNNDHASQPLAFAQNQRRLTGPQRRRPGSLAYL